MRRALKLSLPLALAVGIFGMPTTVATANTIARSCPSLTDSLEIRNLPDRFLSIAYRESRCEFHQINRRGEYSVGYVQVNFRSGLPQRLGWTLEEVMTNEDNYWDMVVDIYNLCGLGPWTKTRRGYSCNEPATQALKLTDVYLIALAKEASGNGNS